jgi:hypothetical protein
MTEWKASTVPDEITPEERQQRLGQVYGLLMALARRKRAEQQQPDGPAQMVDNNISVAGGQAGCPRGSCGK